MFEINNSHPQPFCYSEQLNLLGGTSMNTKEFIQSVNELSNYHVELDEVDNTIFYVLNGPFNVTDDLFYKIKFDTFYKRMDIMQPTKKGPFDDDGESFIAQFRSDSKFSRYDRMFFELIASYSRADDWDKPKKEWLGDSNQDDKPKKQDDKPKKKEMTTKKFIKKVNGIENYHCSLNDNDSEVIDIVENGDIHGIEVNTRANMIKFNGYIADMDRGNDVKLLKVLSKFAKSAKHDFPKTEWFD